MFPNLPSLFQNGQASGEEAVLQPSKNITVSPVPISGLSTPGAAQPVVVTSSFVQWNELAVVRFTFCFIRLSVYSAVALGNPKMKSTPPPSGSMRQESCVVGGL
ncbi:hypothetical protein HPG69_004459 [Diceros bicornis minor]|uniref:Uncharacterized protein n=1 Tax=Diceros bicornis minor TaxID=77932 RepID=A0A7J7F9F4_DICBM|nr:hypothetical protein HPG69_004459 [Diceros bicornis minor]